MPKPGKVTDPDSQQSQFTIGKVLTLDGEKPFINTCPDIEEGTPIIFELRTYDLNPPMEFAVLPAGWDDLKLKKNEKKMKWRNGKLHKDWKRTWDVLSDQDLAKLGVKKQEWEKYHKFDPDQSL